MLRFKFDSRFCDKLKTSRMCVSVSRQVECGIGKTGNFYFFTMPLSIMGSNYGRPLKPSIYQNWLGFYQTGNGIRFRVALGKVLTLCK